MDMLYALAAVLADVTYYSIAVFKVKQACNFGYSLEHFANIVYIFGIYVIAGLDMAFRNDKHMHGCLGSYIVKCVHKFIFVHLFGGDISVYNFAKKTVITHNFIPF